jgi:hypothetical protein
MHDQYYDEVVDSLLNAGAQVNLKTKMVLSNNNISYLKGRNTTSHCLPITNEITRQNMCFAESRS